MMTVDIILPVGDFASLDIAPQACMNFFLHEFGHALGLSHPGGDGFNSTYTTASSVISYYLLPDSPLHSRTLMLRPYNHFGAG